MTTLNPYGRLTEAVTTARLQYVVVGPASIRDPAFGLKRLIVTEALIALGSGLVPAIVFAFAFRAWFPVQDPQWFDAAASFLFVLGIPLIVVVVGGLAWTLAGRFFQSQEAALKSELHLLFTAMEAGQSGQATGVWVDPFPAPRHDSGVVLQGRGFASANPGDSDAGFALQEYDPGVLISVGEQPWD